MNPILNLKEGNGTCFIGFHVLFEDYHKVKFFMLQTLNYKPLRMLTIITNFSENDLVYIFIRVESIRT